jgi:hypothetical protein
MKTSLILISLIVMCCTCKCLAFQVVPIVDPSVPTTAVSTCVLTFTEQFDLFMMEKQGFKISPEVYCYGRELYKDYYQKLGFDCETQWRTDEGMILKELEEFLKIRKGVEQVLYSFFVLDKEKNDQSFRQAKRKFAKQYYCGC